MELPRNFRMRVSGGRMVNIPSVGFGTWAPEGPGWCAEAVAAALRAGYRHLDCAWEYGVDAEIGKGIRLSGIPRKDIFITTKFWPHFAAPDNVEICLDQVLLQMKLEYVDLFLAHFPGALKAEGPLDQARNFFGATLRDQHAAIDDNGNYVPDLEHCPRAVAELNGGVGSFVPTWNAMKMLVKRGKCRAIGVSNFERVHIEELLPHAHHDDVPISCNQIEAHPWYPNTDLINFLHQHEIIPSIYSPFAPTIFRAAAGVVEGRPFRPNGVSLLEEPKVREVAARNHMNVGQCLQSWAVQRGTLPLAKSRAKERMVRNLAVRSLPESDMELLNGMRMKSRTGKCVDINLLFPGLLFLDDGCVKI